MRNEAAKSSKTPSSFLRVPVKDAFGCVFFDGWFERETKRKALLFGGPYKRHTHLGQRKESPLDLLAKRVFVLYPKKGDVKGAFEVPKKM